jgi:pyruvate,water dikinase
VANGRDQAWEELIVHLRRAPNWNTVRAVTGQVADVRLLVLRRLVEDANDLLARREATKATLLALGGEVRRVHLEIARRLVATGALAAVDEVDLLGERELTGVRPMPPASELARRRAWIQQRAGEPPLPERFRGEPPGTHAERAPLGSTFHGWPAGPGRLTGPARVLDEPDPSRLDDGDVLVVRTTDAAWTPVLVQAGAIVVEQGGPLSHAAIVARELGVPAVLNVAGIVARLRDRDASVTVDGDEGTVIVRETDDAG